GMLPLPSPTHPKKQNLVVYTEELTHLYRIVVEVPLHDRLEPLAGLAHRIVLRSRSCCLMSRSFAPMRLRIVLRLTVNRPNLFFPLMCVKPRKSNVSGLPSPLRLRFSSANLPNSIRRVLSG